MAMVVELVVVLVVAVVVLEVLARSSSSGYKHSNSNDKSNTKIKKKGHTVLQLIKPIMMTTSKERKKESKPSPSGSNG